MKKIISLLFLCATFSAFAAVKNWDVVIPDVYRGAAPSSTADYQFLKNNGVRYVINLEYIHDDSRRLCQEFDLRCIEHEILLPPIPWTDHFFNYGVLKKAYAHILYFLEQGDGAVFIHCRWGSDRTGALASALLIREKACHSNFVPDLLQKEIKQSLDSHGFHRKLYPKLYRNIQSWAKNVPEWICAPAPQSEPREDK